MKTPLLLRTFSGVSKHGDVEDGVFSRKVNKGAIMKIFDAISVNADAIPKLKEMNVHTLHYDIEGTHYVISLDRAEAYGFQKTYGKETKLYIPRRHWTTDSVEPVRQLTLA